MTSKFQAGEPDTICSRLPTFCTFGRQPRERFLLNVVEICIAAWQTDLDVGHLSNQPVSNNLRGFVKHGNGTLPRSHLPDDLVLLDGADYRLLFGYGVRQRLFAVDVFLVPRSFGGDDLMPVVGDGDHHGINIVAGQQLTIIVVALAVLIPIGVINLLDGGLQMIGVDIARCDDLAVRQSQKRFRVSGPLPSHAYHAQIDAVIGRGSRCLRTEAAKNGRKNGRRSGSF